MTINDSTSETTAVGTTRGGHRAHSAVAGLGHAVARFWRETSYANRRVVEIQQPWLRERR